MTIINSLFGCCAPKTPDVEVEVEVVQSTEGLPQQIAGVSSTPRMVTAEEFAARVLPTDLGERCLFMMLAQRKHPELPFEKAVEVEMQATVDRALNKARELARAREAQPH